MQRDEGADEGLELLFREQECYAIIKECQEMPAIRSLKPGEHLDNWTSTPLLSPKQRDGLLLNLFAKTATLDEALILPFFKKLSRNVKKWEWSDVVPDQDQSL